MVADNNPVIISNSFSSYQGFEMYRVKILEMLLQLIKLNNLDLNSEFALQKVYVQFLNLIKNYQWNNIMHGIVEQIIVASLGSNSLQLKRSLFEDANLIDFLFDITLEMYNPATPQSNNRPVRKGYLGCVTNIGRSIYKLSQDEDIKAYI